MSTAVQKVAQSRSASSKSPGSLYELTREGRFRFNFHKGQLKAWDSNRRYIVILAGTQSGKTSFGPAWLYREITRRGPGDYLVVTPTFPLLELKALPEFRNLFEVLLRLGRYVGSPIRKFRFSEAGEIRAFGTKQGQPTTVYFGYA